MTHSPSPAKPPEPQGISSSRRGSKGVEFGPWPPPTVLILALCALFDLIFTRFVLRAVDFDLGGLTALQWSRVGGLVRNLGAISALVILTVLLIRCYRARRLAPLTRRLLILLFGATLWFSIVALTFTPRDEIAPRLVFMALASANVTAVLICLEGLRWPTRRPLRFGLFAWTLTLFSSFTSLVLALAGASTGWTAGLRIAGHLRDTGEVAFLATAPLIAIALLLESSTVRSWLAGVVVLCVSAIGLYSVLELPSSEYGVLIYGATRLSLFLDQLPALYLFLFPLALGSSTALALHPEALKRSVGVALILLLCSGYSPASPSTLLLMCTGTTLLAFAMVEMSWRGYQSSVGQAPETVRVQAQVETTAGDDDASADTPDASS